MRLFLGTFVKSDEILLNYHSVRKKFNSFVKGKWVEPINLHFTYHFLGEVNIVMAKELYSEIQSICREYEANLDFIGLGTFPPKQNPRVLFMRIIDENKVLKEIHSNLSKILKKNNFQIDDKEFYPHLTLVRIKHSNVLKVKEIITEFEGKKFGSLGKFTVDLIESQLSIAGPKYSILYF